MSNWALSTCGPCSVAGSNGSPSLRALTSCCELLDELVVDSLLHEQPAAGAAALALVEVEAEHRARHGGVEVGVGEDDVRALAAELEGDPLERLGARSA